MTPRRARSDRRTRAGGIPGRLGSLGLRQEGGVSVQPRVDCASIGMHRGWIAVSGSGWRSRASAVSACVATTTRSNTIASPSAVLDLDTITPHGDGCNRRRGGDSAQVLHHSVDIGPRSTDDRAPSQRTSKRQHPVILQKGEQIPGRVVQRHTGSDRPDAGDDRHDEMRHEVGGIPPPCSKNSPSEVRSSPWSRARVACR